MRRSSYALAIASLAIGITLTAGKNAQADDAALLRYSTKAALNESIDATIAAWQTSSFWGQYAAYFQTRPVVPMCGALLGTIN